MFLSEPMTKVNVGLNVIGALTQIMFDDMRKNTVTKCLQPNKSGNFIFTNLVAFLHSCLNCNVVFGDVQQLIKLFVVYLDIESF